MKINEAEFNKYFETSYEEKAPDFSKHLNVAVVGKVSAGKSSLLNAILERDRNNPLATVGPESGITTKVTAYKLDDHILIVDCPGLEDVRIENSAVTKDFLGQIDVGIFVVTGSADVTQKKNFDDLKSQAKKVIVVLNKIDEWDDLSESAYNSVLSQWKETLGVKEIFGTCSKGYDPNFRKDAPMDLRGVSEVRKELYDFLKKEGKELLFARHLADKEKYAVSIIGSALVAVATEAFIPGSAAYITATQVAAIVALHYLYTGEILSKTSALAILPSFAGESVGMTLFVWAKSFLPPTGVIDLAAACIAMLVTFAMLAAVKWVLVSGYGFDQKERLLEAFNNFKQVGSGFKDLKIADLKDRDKLFSFVTRLLQLNTTFTK